MRLPIQHQLAMLPFLCAALCLLCLCSADNETNTEDSQNRGQNLKPLDINTFHALNRVGAPVVSPDGKRALFTTSYYNHDLNRSATYLSYIDITSGNITQLTVDKPGVVANNPIWFDEKTFGFLRKGVLYKQDLEPNATASSIFSPPVPISNVAYRAGDGIISFIASVYPNATLEESAALKRAEELRKDSAQVYDNLWARHWNEWMTLEKPNVFVAPLIKSKDEWKVGKEHNLVAALPHQSDPLTRWSVDDYAISPSGDRVAFTVRAPNQSMAYSTNVKVYLATTNNYSRPRHLTVRINGMASMPTFSSDGRRLAWLQMETPGFESDRNRIYIHTIASRESIAVAYDWDLSPQSLAWAKDDMFIYATTPSKGRNLIYSIETGTGKRRELTSCGSAGGVRPIDGKSLLYIHSSENQSGDIYKLDVGDCRPKRLTNVNSAKLDNVFLSPAEDFWYGGAQGDRVHGWLLRPFGFDSKRKYPMALLIHGGPHQASAQAFSHAQWNPNMYANAGFVTIVINFHGSSSYGQNFTNSIQHKWGDYPYVDLMRGVDYVTSKYGFVDKSRMVAMGGSYGGYMVNWLNGHTDIFKCFVAHDGKFSTVSGFYGTDELWFPEWDLGKPWEAAGRAILEQNNPERFAASFNTPTLFVHGEKDFRIPITESLSAWTMLRRRGVPARLVYFPDEDHWINRAGNSIRWYTEVLDWITRWTNTTSPYSIR
ncbi:dipeptidylpeptidase [Coemansia sp. RSA 2559]|nr:dipeptidylpeptidase [Coemansia sp. RSA 2559]KAJ2867121.1 dipeptidylpeptidase [Coemansia erecta]